MWQLEPTWTVKRHFECVGLCLEVVFVSCEGRIYASAANSSQCQLTGPVDHWAGYADGKCGGSGPAGIMVAGVFDYHLMTL